MKKQLFKVGLVLFILLALFFITVREAKASVSVGVVYRTGSPYWDSYGRWVWVSGHGEVWVPHTWVGWQPYYYGRWVWDYHHGWVWVSDEPWGWVTYHYGRWSFSPYYGWLWVPGRVWGPGYVAWYHHRNYVAWVPLGPGNRPYYYNYPKYKNPAYKHKYPKYKSKGWVAVDKRSFSSGKYKFVKPGNSKYKSGAPVKGDFRPDKWTKSPPNLKPTAEYKKYGANEKSFKQNYTKRQKDFERNWIKKTGKNPKNFKLNKHSGPKDELYRSDKNKYRNTKPSQKNDRPTNYKRPPNSKNSGPKNSGSDKNYNKPPKQPNSRYNTPPSKKNPPSNKKAPPDNNSKKEYNKPQSTKKSSTFISIFSNVFNGNTKSGNGDSKGKKSSGSDKKNGSKNKSKDKDTNGGKHK
ncbi:hypothetical protein KAU33_07025 [Candidatus Dependentiae bacterium]|nr:hypothetical protein [Candidatus Dependentiae bacterium]